MIPAGQGVPAGRDGPLPGGGYAAAMLVLLPPSEGKSDASPDGKGRHAPVDLGALSLPGLNAARQTVLDALVTLCGENGPGPDKAREVLGLGPRQAGEVAKNAALRTAPARPAGEVYTGVLYEALGLATLDEAARRRARDWLLVFSGLWGALRITDRIPSYRCAAGVRLPGIGQVGRFWREPMAGVLPEAAGSGLVLDLRSSPYAAMWRPAGEVARRTVTVRVVTEAGKVVSHANKSVKGRLVRTLLESGAAPRTPQALAEALADLGFTVRRDEGTAAPAVLDVISGG